MTTKEQELTKYAKNRKQYLLGRTSLNREMSFDEMSCILQQKPKLEEILELVLKKDAKAERIFNEDSMRFAGMANELLSFGAEYGNPRYALLGARIYQKLGKGNRAFVLNSVRKSLENLHVSKRTVINYLDVIGSGITTITSYTDRIANGYRVFEKEIALAREYLEANSQNEQVSEAAK